MSEWRVQDTYQEHFYPADWGSETAASEAALARLEKLRKARGEEITYRTITPKGLDGSLNIVGAVSTATLRLSYGVNGERPKPLRIAFILYDKKRVSKTGARETIVRMRPARPASDHRFD
jgi:hypothetical protein